MLTRGSLVEVQANVASLVAIFGRYAIAAIEAPYLLSTNVIPRYM